MAIDHFFASPAAKAQPETGAEREALLRENHNLKHEKLALEAKVKGLEKQVATLTGVAPTLIELANPPRSGRAPGQTLEVTAQKYLTAMRDLGVPSTAREISEQVGVSNAAAMQWLKGSGKERGVVVVGHRKRHSKMAPLYAIKAAS